MFETNLVSNNSSLEDSILGSWDVHVGLEIKFIGLGFCTWKSSLMDSVFVHGNWAQSTWFSFMELEFTGLDLLVSSNCSTWRSSFGLWMVWVYPKSCSRCSRGVSVREGERVAWAWDSCLVKRVPHWWKW